MIRNPDASFLTAFLADYFEGCRVDLFFLRSNICSLRSSLRQSVDRSLQKKQQDNAHEYLISFLT
jgi:hypothetical protein